MAEEKRQKILEVIKELNFVSKAEAVAVARKLYKKICVVAPFFTQSSFMERLRGIETVLNEEHFEIVIYSINSTEDLKEYSVSGTIINVVLLFICVLWIFPTIGIFITSFRTADATSSTGWWKAFSTLKSFTLDNYDQVLFG